MPRKLSPAFQSGFPRPTNDWKTITYGNARSQGTAGDILRGTTSGLPLDAGGRRKPQSPQTPTPERTPVPTPQLSLCMIVRDEAAMLPGFLERAAGLWDELCVVDTGSRDGSVALLEAAGARVVGRVWDDDFAAARNASLELASGEWILFLDADERVTPGLAEQLRAVCRDPLAGAATVVLRDDLPGGLRRETRLLRLFRNDPAVRFRHRIHEDVSESVRAQLARTGRVLVELDGVLEHLGYRREVAAGRAKKERDLALLRRCLEEDPDDWYSRHKLLELARFWRDPELARELAAEFLPRLEAASRDVLAGLRQAGELLVALADARDLHGDDRAAWLARWERRIPASPALLLELGLVEEGAGRLQAAAVRFTAAAAAAAAQGPAAAAVRPRLALARTAAGAGDPAAALAHVHAALAASPRDPEALMALVAFAAAGGREKEERAFYLREYGDSPAWRRALGEDALRRGRWAEAQDHLVAAAGDPPRGEAGELLARARLGAGDRAGARALCGALMADRPRAALGVLVCDLVDGRDLDLDVDIDQEAADTALADWLDTLWRSGDTAAMTGFLDRLGLVADLFPWLPDHLRRLTDRLVGR